MQALLRAIPASLDSNSGSAYRNRENALLKQLD